MEAKSPRSKGLDGKFPLCTAKACLAGSLRTLGEYRMTYEACHKSEIYRYGPSQLTKIVYYKVQTKDKYDRVRHPVSTLIISEKYLENMFYQGTVLQIGRPI